MTVIAGISFRDALYFGSDRLVKSVEREEKPKLFHGSGFVVGIRGSGNSQSLDEFTQGMSETLTTVDIGGVCEAWVRLSAKLNNEMTQARQASGVWYFDPSPASMNYLMGICKADHVAIYYDGGEGNPLQSVSGAVLFPTGEILNPSFQPHSEEDAKQWVINQIRKNNRAYPHACSGIEVMRVTKDSSEQVQYEPIDSKEPDMDDPYTPIGVF